MLLCTQFVGSRQNFELGLAAEDGTVHPVSGKPEWRLVEHLGMNDEPSVRPLADLAISMDGMTATIHAHAWPGTVIVEVSAAAPHPLPADPTAMPRTKKLSQRIVVRIKPTPEIPATLALIVMPARHRPI